MRRLLRLSLVLALSAAVLAPAAAGSAPACAAEASAAPHAALVVGTGGSTTTYCVALDASSVTGIRLVQLAGSQFGLQYRLGFGGQAVCQLEGVGAFRRRLLRRLPRLLGLLAWRRPRWVELGGFGCRLSVDRQRRHGGLGVGFGQTPPPPTPPRRRWRSTTCAPTRLHHRPRRHHPVMVAAAARMAEATAAPVGKAAATPTVAGPRRQRRGRSHAVGRGQPSTIMAVRGTSAPPRPSTTRHRRSRQRPRSPNRRRTSPMTPTRQAAHRSERSSPSPASPRSAWAAGSCAGVSPRSERLSDAPGRVDRVGDVRGPRGVHDHEPVLPGPAGGGVVVRLRRPAHRRADRPLVPRVRCSRGSSRWSVRTALVLFGTVDAGSVAFALLEGARLATLLVVFGTFNAVTDPFGVVRLAPRRFHEPALAAALALSIAPRTIAACSQVREAQATAGHRRRPAALAARARRPRARDRDGGGRDARGEHGRARTRPGTPLALPAAAVDLGRRRDGGAERAPRRRSS